MKNLNIKETKYTPSVKLDEETGILSVAGKTYPENTFEFCETLIKWIENHFNGNVKANIFLSI